ncbi:MAG: uncharacterized protein KVP18_001183 [Porospora cf. gigantea A]|uniref:uncharacterized protein n=1 Tax=Porospora cf. gigantea A TaxID=2853593 RepID=UPI00355A7E0C|nr:MAG: hypothetical protein KVP18_001183 [Porospora cf. gigantea A]
MTFTYGENLKTAQRSVFNSNTGKKLNEFVAHADYIRHLAVHPTKPYLLSASDDASIKLWSWEKKNTLEVVASFEEHSHYVMCVEWNHKDPKIFASASLDHTIRVWGIPSKPTVTPMASNFTLLGHDQGVNCVAYPSGGDRPFLVSGSDDRTVRIWDYTTKQCLQVLTGHTDNVISVLFNVEENLIISGSEDHSVVLWHANTFKQDRALKFDMSRCWDLSCGRNMLAIGFDDGTVVVNLGSDRPKASFHSGKIVMVSGSDVLTVNLKNVALTADGERLHVMKKDLGVTEVHPVAVSHHPSGRFVGVYGEDQFLIHTAQALRNKAYGSGFDLVWSPEGHYAVRCKTGKITVFHNFQEKFNFSTEYQVDGLLGGALLGVRSADNFVCFYDWERSRCIQRVDVYAQHAFWSPDGTTVALATTEGLFFLRLDLAALQRHTTPEEDQEGLEDAFSVVSQVTDVVDSGVWVANGCFVYMTKALRIQTWTLGHVENLAFAEGPKWLVGYMEDTNMLCAMDKNLDIFGFGLNADVVHYKLAVLQKQFEEAETLFLRIDSSLHSKVARFLDKIGHQETALKVTTDEAHRFALALGLGRLELAAEIASKCGDGRTKMWRQLGDAAMQQGNLALAGSCFKHAQDFNSCLLLFSSTANRDDLEWTAAEAAAAGAVNVSWQASHLLGNTHQVVDILLAHKMIAHAAFYARTYAPEKLPEVVPLWKEKVGSIEQAFADALTVEM